MTKLIRKPRSPALRWLGLLLAFACCFACGRGRFEKTNVVLVVIDTLRADRLSAWGAKRRFSHYLDRLAEEGFSFRNTVAPSSWTKPSIASLMTGRYPGQHGAVGNLAFNRNLLHLDESFITLAECFKQGGFQTAAFVTNPHLLPRYHFDQGFDTYVQPAGRAERLFTQAASWVLSAEEEAPFFLYLHAVDPHSPYQPPERYQYKFAGTDPGPDAPFARRGEFLSIVLWMDQFRDWQPAFEGDRFRFDHAKADLQKRATQIAPNLAKEDLSGAYLDFSGLDDPMLRKRTSYLESLYNAEVVYANDALEMFVQALDEKEILENTIIVVTSDHGEAFLEHNAWGHGHNVHDEEIDIPLIFRIPAGRDQKSFHGVCDDPVSLVDIYPTLLDMIGLDGGGKVNGCSLWPVIQSRGRASPPERPVFSELITERADYTAVVQSGKKLMRTTILDRDPTWRFFDVALDPREENPIDPEAGGADATRLKQALEEMLAQRTIDYDQEADLPPPSAEEIEQLRALGYL